MPVRTDRVPGERPAAADINSIALLLNITEGVAANARIQRFFGDGPPPEAIVGSRPGDEYLDRLTGDLYILQ